MQHAAELHIVTLVAHRSAPEWGCDQFWQGGNANFDSCAAVFATLFKIGNHSSEDEMINNFLDHMPSTAGEIAEVAGIRILDLNAFLPAQRSAFAYFGSLVCPGHRQSSHSRYTQHVMLCHPPASCHMQIWTCTCMTVLQTACQNRGAWLSSYQLCTILLHQMFAKSHQKAACQQVFGSKLYRFRASSSKCADLLLRSVAIGNLGGAGVAFDL